MANTNATLTPTATPIPAVPLLHEFRLSKDAAEWFKSISPNYFQNYEDMERVWNAPVTQFSLTLLQDAEFKGALGQIEGAHAGSRMMGYELVLILFLWIFRSWRLGKVTTLLTRLWTEAWMSGLFWILAVFVLPYIVYGHAYWIVLREISQAILRHFFV